MPGSSYIRGRREYGFNKNSGLVPTHYWLCAVIMAGMQPEMLIYQKEPLPASFQEHFLEEVNISRYQTTPNVL
jgi:hypothetical protein